jgi:hypothetical protein
MAVKRLDRSSFYNQINYQHPTTNSIQRADTNLHHIRVPKSHYMISEYTSPHHKTLQCLFALGIEQVFLTAKVFLLAPFRDITCI